MSSGASTAGPPGLLRNALLSGAIACVATSAVAAAYAARSGRRPLAPVNAVSHVIWGDAAVDVQRLDVAHTVPAVVINAGASVFWAALFEGLFGNAARRGRPLRALAGGAAVAGLAYGVDYHLVPRRLTPGWELALPPSGLAAVFAALALALPVRGLLGPRQR